MDLPVERIERPASLEEALALLADDPAALAVAGGTDVVVQLRDGRRRARILIDLNRLELSWIHEHDDHVEIGAGTPMDMIADSPVVRAAAPALAAAAGLVGAWPIQCRATLGGNLANASPAADTVPPLLVADAELELVSLGGSRTVPLDELLLGPGRTALAPGELIRSIRVPRLPAGGGERFAKLGPRREQIISMVGVAMRAVRGEGGALDGGALHEVRIAVGSAAPRVVRARRAEAALERRRLDDVVRREALRALQADIAPIDDVRAPAAYRRLAAATLLDRFIRELADA